MSCDHNWLWWRKTMNAAKPRSPSSHAVRRNSFRGPHGRKERKSGRRISRLQRVIRTGLHGALSNLTSSRVPRSNSPSVLFGMLLSIVESECRMLHDAVSIQLCDSGAACVLKISCVPMPSFRPALQVIALSRLYTSKRWSLA